MREPNLSPAFDVDVFVANYTKSSSNKRSRLASRSQEELLSEQQHKTQSPRLFSDGPSASGFQNFNGSHQQGNQQMEFQDPAAIYNQQTSNSQGIQDYRIPPGNYWHHPTNYAAANQTSYYNTFCSYNPTTSSSSHDSNLIDGLSNCHPPSSGSSFPIAASYNASTNTDSNLTNYSSHVSYNQQINPNNQNQQYQYFAPIPNPPPTWQVALPANSSFSTVHYSNTNQQTHQPNEEMAIDQQQPSLENDNNAGIIQESHQQINNSVTNGNHSSPLTLNSNSSSPAGQMFPVQSTDIFVTIVSDGSKRKKNILEDNCGNRYSLQRTSSTKGYQTWQCNKTQNKVKRSKCPATIIRSRDDVFRMSTSIHSHQN